MTIFWILAIFVTNLASITVTYCVMKSKKQKAVDTTDYTSWHSGFKTGWESVLSEYSVMKNAIRKLEEGPLR